MNREHNNYGRDQFNIETVQVSVVVQNPETSTRPRYERLLLQRVKQEVALRLEQSLHNKVLIVLGKQEQPEQVKRLWDAEVKIGLKPAKPLLPQTSILEVFEQSEIAGQLLILGAPGAGKTTTMLDLGQSLIEKATQDSSYPIPVLFNLSSWKGSLQSIPTWLVEELNSKYTVRKDIGKKLIEEKQLLPMLDGLDEVKPEHQESCVNFINQWLQGDDRPLFVVVCSRREEYANYQTRLQLNGAIVLQELTDEQIEEYLSDVKRFELWQLLQQDTVLLELVRTPLLLSITVLSYEELSLQKWQYLTSTKQRIKMLLGAYVQRMLYREMESKAYRKLTPPRAEQTQHWLIFLARQLQRESQTEFLIEKIQPSKLLNDYQFLMYSVNVTLISGIIPGLSIGLLFGLLLGLSWGLGMSLAFTLAIGSLYSLFVGLDEPEIQPVETLTWSGKRALNVSLRGLNTLFYILGCISLMHPFFIFSFLSNPGKHIQSIKVLGIIALAALSLFVFALLKDISLIGLNCLLGIILLIVLYSGLTRGPSIEHKTGANQGIWKSLINTGIIMMLLFLISSPIIGLFFGGNFGIVSGLIIGSISTLVLNANNGSRACISHFALRLILYYNDYIPWNYARFLNYCTERGFLQRVGGRYRFIHKQLQDYFAEM